MHDFLAFADAHTGLSFELLNLNDSHRRVVELISELADSLLESIISPLADRLLFPVIAVSVPDTARACNHLCLLYLLGLCLLGFQQLLSFDLFFFLLCLLVNLLFEVASLLLRFLKSLFGSLGLCLCLFKLQVICIFLLHRDQELTSYFMKLHWQLLADSLLDSILPLARLLALDLNVDLIVFMIELEKPDLSLAL